MQIALSNVGHRRALSLLEVGHHVDLLVQLLLNVTLPLKDDPEQNESLARGWIKIVDDSMSKRTIARQLKCNPLENISQVAIEFTTHCNFSCTHCYNAEVERMTETRLEALVAATDVLVDMGVSAFAFIGGEVSKYGNGWLSLARHLRNRGAAVVGLVSNGWFLDRKDFRAAGRHYVDTASYLDELHASGVTHLCFSIDGHADEHDRSRKHSGLYDRIVASFDAVRLAGIEPRVSVLIREDGNDDHLRALSMRIYGNPNALMADGTNILSEFVDLGNGANSSDLIRFPLKATPPCMARCAGLYRPGPHLTLRANGEVATCRLADAGEGYGNFHERPLADILNHMQDTFIYQLHAKRKIGDYLRCVDTKLFGEGFATQCSLRAVTTMIAMRMHRQQVAMEDWVGIARINLEVARLTGHMKEATTE